MKTPTEKALSEIVTELRGIRKELEKHNNEKKLVSYSGETKDTSVYISDLVADMMLKNAMREELERAIEFSKVVMDAKKKYGIELLREKYCNKEAK